MLTGLPDGQIVGTYRRYRRVAYVWPHRLSLVREREPYLLISLIWKKAGIWKPQSVYEEAGNIVCAILDSGNGGGELWLISARRRMRRSGAVALPSLARRQLSRQQRDVWVTHRSSLTRLSATLQNWHAQWQQAQERFLHYEDPYGASCVRRIYSYSPAI